MSIISVDNIFKSFNGRQIFSGLSFEINRQEMIAIVGKSGTGKTTLLNCMGLLEKVDSGNIKINNQIISFRNRRHFFRDIAGFLFQNFALLENETVHQNLNLILHDTDKQARALEKVGLDKNILVQPVYQLSGGEQQRVALARLLLKNPQIIFADEPTASLDRENAKEIIDLLKDLCHQGKTIIVVTHDQTILSKFDRVIEIAKLNSSV
ncbi:TPA: ATP-binding cassette domain-containing protein [Streptococcus suis]